MIAGLQSNSMPKTGSISLVTTLTAAMPTLQRIPITMMKPSIIQKAKAHLLKHKVWQILVWFLVLETSSSLTSVISKMWWKNNAMNVGSLLEAKWVNLNCLQSLSCWLGQLDYDRYYNIHMNPVNHAFLFVKVDIGLFKWNENYSVRGYSDQK